MLSLLASLTHRFKRVGRFGVAGSLCLLIPQTALAQDVPPAAISCETEREQLATQLQTVNRLQSELRDSNARLDDAARTAEALKQVQVDLQTARGSLSTCESARTSLCAAAGNLTSALAEGRFSAAGLSECIDPSAQQNIVQHLSGITNVSATLRQFIAYSSGESDRAPQLGPTSGANLEKVLARLFPAGSTPLVYRRLLIGAIEELTPNAWSRISLKPGSVNAWFSEQGALDEEMLQESRRRFGQGSNLASNASARLSNALGLIAAYESLSACQTSRPGIDCHRAKQLRAMVEVSEPLLLRRLAQDIWASECSNIEPSVVRSWLAEVPESPSTGIDSTPITQGIHLKLLSCYLGSTNQQLSFRAWVTTKMPDAKDVTAGTFVHLKTLERSVIDTGSLSNCTQATRSLKALEAPTACQIDASFFQGMDSWSKESERLSKNGLTNPEESLEPSAGFALCDGFNRALWSGEAAFIPSSFDSPPAVEDMIQVRENALPSSMHRLRELCENRTGHGEAFERSISSLARLGKRLGEEPEHAPFLVKDNRSIESHLVRNAEGNRAWFNHLTSKLSACGVMHLTETRCQICEDSAFGTHFDCSHVQTIQNNWRRKNALVLTLAIAVLLTGFLLTWAMRLRRAMNDHGEWSAHMRRRFTDLGLMPQLERSRFIFPSKFSRIIVELPQTAAWRRWGDRAVVMRSLGEELRGIEVNLAGSVAGRHSAHLAFVVHEDHAKPNLSSVRAILEWATRGSKAVQVVPLALSRMNWSHDALDLLELAEESSLRSNPFEVRGRVNTSSQFFNRERLVSGLLASAQSGHVTVVTGLRRFGKSSLALEVARRLPGPSAYVDLAGFHHEIRFSQDPAQAADAILRFLCHRLADSARSRTNTPDTVSLEVPSGSMDANALTAWFQAFDTTLKNLHPGQESPPVLIILDEVEQAFGAAKELGHALDVLGILVGRLRNSLPGALHERTGRVGILFCSALHPLLWSPLGSLAHQSLIGSFHYVSVPSLPEEASREMMNGLGARQGIRFTDAALSLLIRESQGVPLLLRRLGSVVLELYDPERAQQGALGAVEIGVEGAKAALEREESEGSPLRVWIESEIAEPHSPGGSVLRALAVAEWLPAHQLRKIAAEVVQNQFTATGLSSTLSEEEGVRRAQEAAAVVVRMLGNSGLLVSRGDPTEPEGYELPSGVIRRVLRLASSEFPNVHPAQ